MRTYFWTKQSQIVFHTPLVEHNHINTIAMSRSPSPVSSASSTAQQAQDPGYIPSDPPTPEATQDISGTVSESPGPGEAAPAPAPAPAPIQGPLILPPAPGPAIVPAIVPAGDNDPEYPVGSVSLPKGGKWVGLEATNRPPDQQTLVKGHPKKLLEAALTKIESMQAGLNGQEHKELDSFKATLATSKAAINALLGATKATPPQTLCEHIHRIQTTFSEPDEEFAMWLRQQYAQYSFNCRSTISKVAKAAARYTKARRLYAKARAEESALVPPDAAYTEEEKEKATKRAGCIKKRKLQHDTLQEKSLQDLVKHAATLPH